MKILISLILFFSAAGFASEQYCNGKTKRDSWGFYYPNGQKVLDSWGTYYPNGNVIADSWGRYYPNDKTVIDSWGVYYPNGNIIVDSWGCYSSTGQSLTCGEHSFRARAPIADFGSVVVQVDAKTKKPGQFEFHQIDGNDETIILIDFSSNEVIDVDFVCH